MENMCTISWLECQYAKRYLTCLRVDGGRQGVGCWEGRGGVGSGLGGWAGAHRPKKNGRGTAPTSTLPQPRLFPKKGTGAPLALVLLSSNLPPPQYPPPFPNVLHLNKIRENATICSGNFLGQSWTCSGPLKIKCLQGV